MANKIYKSTLFDDIDEYSLDDIMFIIRQGLGNPDERARFHSRRKWQQDREHEHAVALKEGQEIGQKIGQEIGQAMARAHYEPILESKDAEIESKDAEIANMADEIAALRKRLGEGQ